VKEVIVKPGLHFKWPLIQNVRLFDMRILTFDDAEPLRFITSEKKPVLVDSFVKWRIVDVKQYYVSVQGEELRAQTRLKQTISGGLQNEFNKRTVHEVVSGERDKIMEEVRVKADQELRRDLGVELVDVRLKRVDLPQEVSESVYRRMEAERKRIANELRSTGSAEAERIRADAERQLRDWGRRSGVRVSILRVPGIYAADRLPLARITRGTPALTAEEDAYVNHVHADDLARIVVAALRRGGPGRMYNAADDAPIRMGDYFDLVADRFGLPHPPRVTRAEADRVLPENLRSFMNESRRLVNRRLKQELRFKLHYPNVRYGILAAARNSGELGSGTIAGGVIRKS